MAAAGELWQLLAPLSCSCLMLKSKIPLRKKINSVSWLGLLVLTPSCVPIAHYTVNHCVQNRAVCFYKPTWGCHQLCHWHLAPSRLLIRVNELLLPWKTGDFTQVFMSNTVTPTLSKQLWEAAVGPCAYMSSTSVRFLWCNKNTMKITSISLEKLQTTVWFHFLHSVWWIGGFVWTCSKAEQ